MEKALALESSQVEQWEVPEDYNKTTIIEMEYHNVITFDNAGKNNGKAFLIKSPLAELLNVTLEVNKFCLYHFHL